MPPQIDLTSKFSERLLAVTVRLATYTAVALSGTKSDLTDRAAWRRPASRKPPESSLEDAWARTEGACRELVVVLIEMLPDKWELPPGIRIRRIGDQRVIFIGHEGVGFCVGGDNEWFESLDDLEQHRIRKPLKDDWLMFLEKYLPHILGRYALIMGRPRRPG